MKGPVINSRGGGRRHPHHSHLSEGENCLAQLFFPWLSIAPMRSTPSFASIPLSNSRPVCCGSSGGAAAAMRSSSVGRMTRDTGVRMRYVHPVWVDPRGSPVSPYTLPRQPFLSLFCRPCGASPRSSVWCSDVRPDGLEVAIGSSSGSHLYDIEASLGPAGASPAPVTEFHADGSDVLSQVPHLMAAVVEIRAHRHGDAQVDHRESLRSRLKLSGFSNHDGRAKYAPRRSSLPNRQHELQFPGASGAMTMPFAMCNNQRPTRPKLLSPASEKPPRFIEAGTCPCGAPASLQLGEPHLWLRQGL